MVHVTGPVPARVHEALAESFALADGVEGVDGILALLTTKVDAALLDRVGPQFVLTPHLGSATRETREAMGLLAVDALRAVLVEGRRPANAVP
jgi:lactate dehydrogenase-like 2-hydroxyacid dehydrogenase